MIIARLHDVCIYVVFFPFQRTVGRHTTRNHVVVRSKLGASFPQEGQKCSIFLAELQR